MSHKALGGACLSFGQSSSNVPCFPWQAQYKDWRESPGNCLWHVEVCCQYLPSKAYTSVIRNSAPVAPCNLNLSHCGTDCIGNKFHKKSLLW